MKGRVVILIAIVFGLLSFARPDKEFKVFQFPQNQIPRIDGDLQIGTSYLNPIP